jgi:putative oxidoreductase
LQKNLRKTQQTRNFSRRQRITLDEMRNSCESDPREEENVSVNSIAMMDVERQRFGGTAHWAAIPLRLITGYGFIAHGLAKVMNGPEHFITILHSLGVPAPGLIGRLTILIEIIGGVAVLTGAFVRAFSLPMSAILLVAMFTVHLPYGFSSIKLRAVTTAGAKFGPPGYEVDLLYLACLATLVLGGPGPFTIESIVAKLRARSGK